MTLAIPGRPDKFQLRVDATKAVVSKRSTPTTAADAVAAYSGEQSFSDWITEAIDQGVKPEQALAVVGLGLMRGMGGSGLAEPVLDADFSTHEAPLSVQAIKARLESIALAIETGAPLTTQEVTVLIGARPGSAKVRRAGVVAERISRNVWQLRHSRNQEREAASTGFSEGFRRRL
ncbi:MULTISPECIES: hypothetical protein [Synechococcaceae]|uniref:hypothetical protein n=1 Tax=Synechococcaceae TaxID=1890426 RepID=UPI000B102822|nr:MULTISPECIES: hypothetical protein [Synechococcaceae]MCT4364316.1 hypothetical protein [Candidatus Regnicoccus frigidus MAG-AL1]TWB93284.1 hypothetical protein FB106_10465 [Synechococcus sp. Ace-Pa]